MNMPQKMFHDFVMGMVKDERRDDAERLMEEGFARQDAGTFDAAYLASVTPTYLDVVKEDQVEKVRAAIASYAARL
nr:hypothetical protein [uncultured Olsenella sp.]